MTGYCSRSITHDDKVLVKEFLAKQDLFVPISRVFKEENKYIIKVGSVKKFIMKKDEIFKENLFDIRYGDFSPYLSECISLLN